MGDRDALLADVLLSEADAAMPLPDSGSFRADVILVLEDLRRLLASPVGAAFAEVVIASRTESSAELRRRYWTDRLADVSVIVERAVARGEFAATPIRASPSSCSSAASHAGAERPGGARRGPPGTHRRACLTGLAKRP